MNELYLHHLWQKKRINLLHLRLADGRPLTIKNFGTYNKDKSGPDFAFACIEIDGLEFIGSVEIHVKASDWYRHNHDKDENYNNVILHVVKKNDCKVIQNGFEIPALEIGQYIEQEHFHNYMKNLIYGNEFLCHRFISSMPSVYLEFMKNRALYMKLNSKIRNYQNQENTVEVLYRLLASSFGMGINSDAFTELATKVSYSKIRVLSLKGKSDLLLSESGLLQRGNDEQYNYTSWHFKGTRPGNFPAKRIRQFAELIENFDFNTGFQYLEIGEITAEFSNMVHNSFSGSSNKPSRQFINHLIVNGIVPYLWYLGNLYEKSEYCDKAINVLETLPPENNSLINKWKTINISVKNAYDSQSLIALHRYYCSHKKCLSCGVGNKIMCS